MASTSTPVHVGLPPKSSRVSTSSVAAAGHGDVDDLLRLFDELSELLARAGALSKPEDDYSVSLHSSYLLCALIDSLLSALPPDTSRTLDHLLALSEAALQSGSKVSQYSSCLA